eukprot:4903785-Pyramimonas_sp.AAC.1
MATNRKVWVRWVPSELNPADEPSRRFEPTSSGKAPRPPPGLAPPGADSAIHGPRAARVGAGEISRAGRRPGGGCQDEAADWGTCGGGGADPEEDQRAETDRQSGSRREESTHPEQLLDISRAEWQKILGDSGGEARRRGDLCPVREDDLRLRR